MICPWRLRCTSPRSPWHVRYCPCKGPYNHLPDRHCAFASLTYSFPSPPLSTFQLRNDTTKTSPPKAPPTLSSTAMAPRRLLTLLSLLILALCASAAKQHQQPKLQHVEEAEDPLTAPPRNTTATTPGNTTATATPGARSNMTSNANETSTANTTTLVDPAARRSLRLLQAAARTVPARNETTSRNETTPGARTNQTNTTTHAHNQTTPAANQTTPRVVNLTDEHSHRVLGKFRAVAGDILNLMSAFSLPPPSLTSSSTTQLAPAASNSSSPPRRSSSRRSRS